MSLIQLQNNTIKIPDIYIPFVILKRRFKVIYGGRGSAKSRFFALLACYYASQGFKVVCAREFQSSIKHSVYELIKSTIETYKLDGFDPKKTEIKHNSGGRLVFIGLGRNPDATRSLENAKICWIEEAQFLKSTTIQTLTPSIRGQGSEIWLSGNAIRKADPFSQKFIERKLPFTVPEYPNVQCDNLYMRVKTTYKDNNFFPEILENERKDDFNMLNRSLYDHIWGGEYNETVDHAIIRAEWVDAAIDAHKKWNKFGLITATHDPADSHDARATLIRHGNTVVKIHENKSEDINASCEVACDMAREFGATAFTWDASGCGLALRKQIHDFWRGKAILTEFLGGSKAENPDDVAMESNGIEITNSQYFRNLRAQQYFKLAERFRKTYMAVVKGKYIDPHELISISSTAGNIEKLRSELTAIPRKLNSERVYALMSKEEMQSKLKIESPNLADCLMMSEIEIRETTDWFTKDQKLAEMHIA